MIGTINESIHRGIRVVPVENRSEVQALPEILAGHLTTNVLAGQRTGISASDSIVTSGKSRVRFQGTDDHFDHHYAPSLTYASGEPISEDQRSRIL